MKTVPYILFIITALVSGCTDQKAQKDKARQDADAKARAEAAKKEMQTLPEAFKPRYNRKLDQTTETQDEPEQAEQKKNP
jgi:hypothetical protein